MGMGRRTTGKSWTEALRILTVANYTAPAQLQPNSAGAKPNYLNPERALKPRFSAVVA